MRANNSAGPLANRLAAIFPFSHGYKRPRPLGVFRNPSTNFSTPRHGGAAEFKKRVDGSERDPERMPARQSNGMRSLFSLAQGHAVSARIGAFRSDPVERVQSG